MTAIARTDRSAGRPPSEPSRTGRSFFQRQLDRSLERRALINARAVAPFVVGPMVLDVGAAEGWVGQALADDDIGLMVSLLDVVDLNLATLPLTLYDGLTFPFGDDTFDTVLVMLTLHHCDDPVRVLAEASRVARRRVIVTESVYRTSAGRWLLWTMDNGLNGLRSGWQMPGGLHFAPVAHWLDRFRDLDLAVIETRWLSRGLHRHVAFVLEPPYS